MPRRKNGELYYTKEQYQIARYEASALEYARQNGYTLVPAGNTAYCLKEHDSMIFTRNGAWFWNSRHLQGGAIEFITQYEHRSLIEAVLLLAGENIYSHDNTEKPKRSYTPSTEDRALKKAEFVLPEQMDNMKRLFGYLAGNRKLDAQILRELIKEKKIYLSKPHGNAVFVAYDKDGNPASAFQRGTNTFVGKAYKRDVSGSDKSHPFHMQAADPECRSVVVLESAIECISHATISKLSSGVWKDTHRIAIGGIANRGALNRFLSEHPNVNEIVFSFNNDYNGMLDGKPHNHGQAAAAEYMKEYAEKGYITSNQKPHLNDWNEVLLSGLEADKTHNQAENADYLEL